jgi:sugar phosphate isomerase/epimerase
VKYAGNDPVQYIQKYAGRVPVLHFKDYYAEGEQEENPYELIGDESSKPAEEAAKTFEFRPLGQGVQDVAALLKAGEEAGCKWIVIEQDQPSMGKTPMESIKMSVEYLKKLQKAN